MMIKENNEVKVVVIGTDKILRTIDFAFAQNRMETDMASKTSASGNRLIANNKKAYFDYFIEEKYEAGMVLHGTEVKSIRAGKCSIKESYIKIENGEVYVLGMNITPYEKGNIFNKDPLRPKKLLLHKNQINKLTGELTIKGYTLVPLQVYLKEGKVKMEIGLGKGKKNFDKRDSIAKKDQIRDAQKEFKNKNLRFQKYFISFE